MLVAAAVCPHPPLLVPEIAVGAAPELDELRAACDKALHRLRDVDVLILVGSGPLTRSYGCVGGSLAPYGLDVRVGHGPPELPLSLTIGLWLVERVGLPARPQLQAVGSTASVEECVRLGKHLADTAERTGLLVMGDGSARREVRSPGYVDARATGFDATVRQALATADSHTLLGLDPGVCDELLVAGRAPWQVLAGAAGEGTFAAELLADETPYGVSYLVASWLRGT